jgi:large subunit ribosomal protein L10
MRREEKNAVIDSLAEQINQYPHFYITDTSNLNAAATSNLRRKCFEKNIKMVVVKNTLLIKALERSEKTDFTPIYDSLKGVTSVMFTDSGSVPAKLIKDFRRTSDRPLLKAAFVEESFYVGDNQLTALATLKTKNELIADVVAILQSPAKTVISQLQSGRNILAGVVKTLGEREG